MSFLKIRLLSFVKEKIVKDFAILLADRGMQLISQVFNIFILAAFLGPVKFGILTYSLSLFAFLYTLSNFGFDRILVIEILHGTTPKIKSDIVVTGIIIKLVVSIISFLFIVLGKSFFLKFVSEEVYSAFRILSINIFFYAWILMDGFNQSISKFHITAIARIIAAFISILIKAIIVFCKGDFTWVLISFIIEQAICLGICLIKSDYFRKSIAEVNYFESKFQWKLIRSGFSVLLSGLCFVVLLKISQTFVESNFSKHFLGLFALTITLFEVPVSLANIMATLFMPKLTSLTTDKSDQRFFGTSILFTYIVIGIFSAICVIIVAYILSLVIGSEYSGFMIMVIKGSFSIPIIFAGYCMNSFLMAEKQMKAYLITSISGTIGCVLMWFFAKGGVTENNVVYLYVVSHFVGFILMPLIVSKVILQKWQFFLKSLFKRNFGALYFLNIRQFIK